MYYVCEDGFSFLKESNLSDCVGGVCKLIPDNEEESTNNKVIYDLFPYPNEEDEWTVYGAKWCGFCRRAKKLLEDKEVKFVYYDVESIGNFSKGDVQKILSPLTSNHTTIPIIFNNNEFIGGFDQLKKWSAKSKIL